MTRSSRSNGRSIGIARQSRSSGRSTAWRRVLSRGLAAVAAIALSGILAACGDQTTPAGNQDRLVGSASAPASSDPALPRLAASSLPVSSPAAASRPASSHPAPPPPPKVAPVRTTAPPPSPPSQPPAAPVSPQQQCQPLTNGGNCYEPGEFCRKSDHGRTGVAGDGRSISCVNNNGWRWEPTG
ncbi:MAG TPA: hypothetical protein VHO01_09075 [Jatrophihabitans sp.]|nr:hypothetical protein [Jatrophihabitans sp.]